MITNSQKRFLKLYLFLLNRSKLADIREELDRLGKEGGKLGEGVEATGFLNRWFIKNVFTTSAGFNDFSNSLEQ